MVLNGKSILLGITGSIAAYKSIDIIKGLRQEGASVQVIMTKASRHFISPLSIEIASDGNVYCDMFESPLSHLSLPADSNLFVIAPATANIISKYANGSADDLLSAAMLAFSSLSRPMIIAPAMNWKMYESPVFQRNLKYLISIGVKTVGPERGSLACGEEGIGRMADIGRIIEAIKGSMQEQDLAGDNILVTAGPTREYIDPIRYISNRSSGKMGYAIAKIAKRRGAEVTLISGPTSVVPPDGVNIINTETTNDMYKAVMDNISWSSIFVMSAAVADFMPAETKKEKIEKGDVSLLNLIKTTDILKEVGKLKDRPIVVGFSAEVGYKIERARRKLFEKGLDMIVFNDVTADGSGFDVDTNEVVIIDREGERKLPMMSKEDVAMKILDKIKGIKKTYG